GAEPASGSDREPSTDEPVEEPGDDGGDLITSGRVAGAEQAFAVAIEQTSGRCLVDVRFMLAAVVVRKRIVAGGHGGTGRELVDSHQHRRQLGPRDRLGRPEGAVAEA